MHRRLSGPSVCAGSMALPIRSRYVLLGIFFFTQFSVCISGNKHHKSTTGLLNQPDTSITCYQCNSEYDPRCADPFDPYSLGMVNCSLKKPLEHMKEYKPVLCRKTIQKVQGLVRVIRGCGYITDERDDKQCVRRTGTHDVILHYCSCTRSLCNGATGTTHPTTNRVINSAIIAVMLSIAGLYFGGQS